MGATAQSISPTLAARNPTVHSMLVRLGKWESDQLGTPTGCLSSNHAAPFFAFFSRCVSTVPWRTKNRKYDRSGSLDYIIFTPLIYQVAMIVLNRYYSKTSSHGANPVSDSPTLPFLPTSRQRVLSGHHFGPIYSFSGVSVGNQPQPPERQLAVHLYTC